MGDSGRHAERSARRGDESCLKLDSGPGGRVLLFSSSKAEAALRDASEVAFDGTFNAAPFQFAQLFIVHARVREKFIPTHFCLLPGKEERFYREVFQYLQATSERFLCDFGHL